ncbi:uncharacterized protein BDV14DRAFT_195122 [Aspergillus stella-maris]|uniref:uncharacterized protein n=1 Tax=Aspergillus stella-maris TaxID=1810926 RepID=UPI003CCCAD5E
MRLPLWSTFLFVPFVWGYDFLPDDTQILVDPRIPVLFDISTSQTLPFAEAPISGYWASSFITATDGSQYFLSTGILASQTMSAYGASILDLTTLARSAYFQPTTFTDSNLQSFNLSSAGYEFSGLPPNNLDMKLRSNTPSLFFDVTMHATSPAYYYCGSGAYTFINGTMNNWVFPASKTSGTISIPVSDTNTDDTNAGALERIELDSDASMTWYDRIWGSAENRNGNSTFLILYFPTSTHDIRMWVSLVDSYDPPFSSRSANIRARGETWHHLLPVDSFEPDLNTGTWTSHRTGLVYPQSWTFSVEGRGEFIVRSIKGDQEFAVEGAGGQGGATYIGFAEVEGVFDGESVSGYGVAELRLAPLV